MMWLQFELKWSDSDMNHLQIQMFGDFTLRNGDAVISDNRNRTKKVWLLLAYLLHERGRIISRKELISLLWGEDTSSSTPENALKITLHRTRSLLDQLGPSAGHQLVIWQDNGYTWNTEVPMTLDIAEFDRLCTAEYQDEETRLAAYVDALKLYQGNFLSNLPAEGWILPLSSCYHKLYMETVLYTAPLLTAHARYEESIDILKKAITMKPCSEQLYLLLMQAQVSSGDRNAALISYETLSQRLFSEQGTKPGQEIHQMYRSIMQAVADKSLSMENIIHFLQEEDSGIGALKCDYDYFKVLYHAEARASARSGNLSHIALLTVTGKKDNILSSKSLEQAMEQLGGHIRLNLRRGDAFTRCSICQYILILREANFENSCMVCERIIHVFEKAHPHSRANIDVRVELLTPNAVTK